MTYTVSSGTLNLTQPTLFECEFFLPGACKGHRTKDVKTGFLTQPVVGLWKPVIYWLPDYVTSHVMWLILSTGICIKISAYGTERLTSWPAAFATAWEAAVAVGGRDATEYCLDCTSWPLPAIMPIHGMFCRFRNIVDWVVIIEFG